jgi:hypothetical protein
MMSFGSSVHGGVASLLCRLLVTSLALLPPTQAQADIAQPGPAADQFSVAARCPLSCGKDGNWALFRDYDELKSCDKTVLLNLNLYNKIDEPTSAIGIRACAANSGVSKLKPRQEVVVASSNSTSSGSHKNQTASDIQIYHKGNGGTAASVQSAISALASQLGGAEDGTTTALFAKAGDVVIGVYGGLQISELLFAYVLGPGSS